MSNADQNNAYHHHSRAEQPIAQQSRAHEPDQNQSDPAHDSAREQHCLGIAGPINQPGYDAGRCNDSETIEHDDLTDVLCAVFLLKQDKGKSEGDDPGQDGLCGNPDAEHGLEKFTVRHDLLQVGCKPLQGSTQTSGDLLAFGETRKQSKSIKDGCDSDDAADCT